MGTVTGQLWLGIPLVLSSESLQKLGILWDSGSPEVHSQQEGGTLLGLEAGDRQEHGGMSGDTAPEQGSWNPQV